MAAPPVPKLPGYTVNLPYTLGDKSFKKGQTLAYLKGYQNESAVRVVGDTTSPLPHFDAGFEETGTGSPTHSPYTGSPNGTAQLDASLPKWVANDRKVLRFHAYFKEAVVESNVENHRIRKVVLYYYLEDDSMHVAEPKQDNSGIPQGVFIKRHRILKDDGSPFKPTDFSVGMEVSMYGRTYFIVDADQFTREWCAANLGAGLSEALPYPDDPIDAFRSRFAKKTDSRGPPNPRNDDLTRFIEAKLGKAPHVLEKDKLKQFLDNNRKVLRFWCVWDDRQAVYGDRRPYILHYFLEDDTVEVLEVNENNSGRDPFPIFLKRGPLPKVKPRTFGVTIAGKPRKDECYSPRDFRLGEYIVVHNRVFLLHDADGFTKHWYEQNLGYTDGELTAIDVTEQVDELPKPALPPHNGYGTLEDSLQNTISLVPKPPKRDMHKLMNKDKIVLRFACKMAETPTFKLSHADEDRRFILSYYMMDDSLAVFEPPLRNSGIIGGKFLERQRVYKPHSEETYTYQDLFVGGQLDVHSRGFELLEADEYTYTYMENNKHMFIMADADAILKSLRSQVVGKEDAIRTAFIEMDTDGSGHLVGAELEQALLKANLKFTRHQIVALRRRLDKDRSGAVSIEEFLSAMGIPHE